MKGFVIVDQMIRMLSKRRVLIFDTITVQAGLDNRRQNKYTTPILIQKNCDHITQYFLDRQLISNNPNFDYAFIDAWILNSTLNAFDNCISLTY
jgi:hypothetical protein